MMIEKWGIMPGVLLRLPISFCRDMEFGKGKERSSILIHSIIMITGFSDKWADGTNRVGSSPDY